MLHSRTWLAPLCVASAAVLAWFGMRAFGQSNSLAGWLLLALSSLVACAIVPMAGDPAKTTDAAVANWRAPMWRVAGGILLIASSAACLWAIYQSYVRPFVPAMLFVWLAGLAGICIALVCWQTTDRLRMTRKTAIELLLLGGILMLAVGLRVRVAVLVGVPKKLRQTLPPASTFQMLVISAHWLGG